MLNQPAACLLYLSADRRQVEQAGAVKHLILILQVLPSPANGGGVRMTRYITSKSVSFFHIS